MEINIINECTCKCVRVHCGKKRLQTHACYTVSLQLCSRAAPWTCIIIRVSFFLTTLLRKFFLHQEASCMYLVDPTLQYLFVQQLSRLSSRLPSGGWKDVEYNWMGQPFTIALELLRTFTQKSWTQAKVTWNVWFYQDGDYPPVITTPFLFTTLPQQPSLVSSCIQHLWGVRTLVDSKLLIRIVVLIYFVYFISYLKSWTNWFLSLPIKRY